MDRLGKGRSPDRKKRLADKKKGVFPKGTPFFKYYRTEEH